VLFGIWQLRFVIYFYLCLSGVKIEVSVNLSPIYCKRESAFLFAAKPEGLTE